MTWLEQSLNDYKKEHQTLGNEICHFFGISLILFSKFALTLMFSHDSMPYLGMFVSSWLIIGEWRGLIAALYFGILVFTGLAIITSWKILVFFFVVGWILLIIGHKVFEKNNPAFAQKGFLSWRALKHTFTSFFMAIFWIGEVIGKLVILYPLWGKAK
mgnify:FL=1